jgi:hypothetical protein
VPTPDTDARGFVVADLARRYRVGEDKVRYWIKKGILRAVNTSDAACARPRYVVTAEALAEFELARRAATEPPRTPRRRRQPALVDYYPD